MYDYGSPEKNKEHYGTVSGNIKLIYMYNNCGP